MKYAEALTNLHKSGINRNSTPQEIAAASVGTTVNKNGTPNISSVSQGQSYGSALKNLKSNPQPNVNQNSNGTKPNTTGSQNNTGNKANTNPTGSTKPLGSTTANRSASSTNSTSSSNKFTNDEYSQLAAQVTGIAVDPKGRPVFSSYEESMKYAEALNNLHKSGINKNSTPFEIAAASVGAKNGIPVFNPSQLLNYGRALGNLLKDTKQVVSSVDTVPTGSKKTEDKISTTSSQYTQKEIEQMEETRGTMYVWEHVYNKDTSQYDPYKRASQLLGGIPLRGNEPYACGSEGVKAFKAKLYGANNTYVSPKGAKVSSGKVYTTKDILSLNGSTVFVVNDGEVEKGENVTVNIDEELAEIIMTTSNEFNIDPTLIIAVMAHESRFDSEASSGLASGLMQVNDIYFPTYASENKELIESLGGDYTNIYDEAANIVAWGASYSIWVDTYGDNKNSLKALRQGYIQPDNYPDGWSPNATNNANEFMDIKNELDNMIK